MAGIGTGKGDGGKRTFLATPVGLVLGALACCGLWGSAFPCIKLGYALFGVASGDTASQMLFAGTRFTLAGIMVVVGMSLAQRKPLAPRKADIRPILVLALFQTVGQYTLFYMGLSKATGMASSIIESSSTFMCILLAALVFHTDRLNANKVLGCVVGMAGVTLVNLGGASGGLSFALDGEGLVFLSGISSAISTCLIGIYSQEHDGVLLSGWQFVIGGLVLLGIGLGMGGQLHPQAIAPAVGLIAYMGFISAMAYSLWARLLSVNPVSRVSVFGFMNPVFGVALSALLLGEGADTNPFVFLAALSLVCLGIVLVNRDTTPAEKDGEAATRTNGMHN